MKILGLTDLHTDGQIPIQAIKELIEKEEIELIIHAGDISTHGSSTFIKKILEEFAQIDLPQLYIPGNMDAADSGDIQFDKIFPLHARVKSIQGISFLGLGGSNPTPFNTPNEIEEEEITNILNNTIEQWDEKEPLFLVSHPPPKNTDADKVRLGRHVGSQAVRTFVEQHKPIAVLCGHIHESQAICKIGATFCINPGSAREHNAAIIDIKKGKNNELKVEGKIVSF